MFRILGPLEISHSGGLCPALPPKVRCVLALLLSRTNHVVATETLMTELWRDRLPASATTTLQTYVYQLRKMLSTQTGTDPITTHQLGYLLRVPREQIDATTFEAEIDAATAYLSTGRAEETITHVQRALALYRGAPLADVPCGPLLEARAVHLGELRMRAAELRVEAELALGHHRRLIGELQSLVAEYPLNEWLHGRLIAALNRSGRRAEALQVYRRLRGVLDAELGLTPSAEVESLHLQVLTGEGERGETRHSA
ncbi:AfsR/SARP family transcriptional regulator [Actinomadura rubrisoli]|nr:AfsR/SARP family transcriptional regulator [Actinomadura rubrisoli]